MLSEHPKSAGKVTIFTVLFGVLLLSLAVLTDIKNGGLPSLALANLATTSVTVLNTAPAWTTDAEESSPSSTTTPTNTGTAVSWVGTATDSSNDSYYLIICKTGASSTANAGSAPTCGGGAGNQWAVSLLTVSGAVATAATTTTEAMAESNAWYAWICDANLSNPQCNWVYKQGTYPTESPFSVNHRPTFTIYADDSPKNPGQLVTWTTTASDTDVDGTADTVKMFVCKSADFTGTDCGAGGAWATSTLTASNPTSSYTLPDPKPDGTYNAYGYVVDSHNHSAAGGQQAVDSILTVNNMTPTISSSTVSLLDTDGVGNLTLLTPQGQTTGFQVKFTVSDQNSCVTQASTTEIISMQANVFRSGVGSSSCVTSGQYNANNCYPYAVGTSMWNVSCVQDVGSCINNTDSDATFTCTFPLWYVADATDGTGVASTDPPFFAQDWLPSVFAADNNFASTTITQGSTSNELVSFLAYNVATTSIAYGGLQPGQSNNPIIQTTDMSATGNVGLDQTLYGLDMCVTFPVCTGYATSTIFVTNQVYGSSSVAYGAGIPLALTPGAWFDINVGKTTVTTTPQVKNTYWGILVPGSITFAGDYIGRNTLIGVTGERANW